MMNTSKALRFTPAPLMQQNDLQNALVLRPIGAGLFRHTWLRCRLKSTIADKGVP